MDELRPLVAVRVDAEARGEVLGHGRDRARHLLIIRRVGRSSVLRHILSLWRKTDRKSKGTLWCLKFGKAGKSMSHASPTSILLNIGHAMDHWILVVFAYSWGVIA